MVRYKNRYITIEVESETPGNDVCSNITSKNLAQQIHRTVNRLHGDFGIASIKKGFTVSYCNEITKIAIIRVRHGPHKFVTSSLAVITKIGKTSVKINTLYVGATLHQCYKVILKHQRETFRKLLPNIKPEEMENFKTKILNIGGILPKNKREL